MSNQPYTPNSREVVACHVVLRDNALAGIEPFLDTEDSCRILAQFAQSCYEAGKAEAQSWIPVTPETMPQDTKEPILLTDGKDRCIGDGHGLHYQLRKDPDVAPWAKFWQPLPALPTPPKP